MTDRQQLHRPLRQPLLYLSLFFKRHRAEYYRRLDGVRSQGDFEGWLAFFLEGTAVVAEEAVATIQELFALVTADRARVLGAKTTSVMAARLFERLPEHPIVTISRAAELLATTGPTASKAVSALVEAGVLVETTGRRRDRTFGYAAYLERLRAGTEIWQGAAMTSSALDLICKQEGGEHRPRRFERAPALASEANRQVGSGRAARTLRVSSPRRHVPCRRRLHACAARACAD